VLLAPCQPLCYSLIVETKKDAPILKVSGEDVAGTIDVVAVELPIRLVLNTSQLVTLLCTPTELEELAIGFLLSEGLLRNRTAIQRLEIIEKELTVKIELSDLPADWGKLFEKRTISSGCGKGITFTSNQLTSADQIRVDRTMITLAGIRRLLTDFRTLSKLYLETGGVHSAALSDGNSILFFSEDIGRHNAVDKLIGKSYLRSVPVEDKMLLTSGRVSSEIVAKAGRNRIPLLISRAAPTCMAISLAEDLGITLVGFARGDRMNIYTWPNRIALK